MIKRKREPTFGNYRHGGTTQHTKSPEYIVWSGMRDRCRNPNNKRYDRYGGRGIKVCERWNDFALFLADMGPRPSLEHSINRLDNDGDYEPGNCEWATLQAQNSNQSHTQMVAAFGQVRSVSEWARETGISRSTIRDRLRRGVSAEEALR